MSITITLTFGTAAEARDALARLAAPAGIGLDDPSVGAPLPVITAAGVEYAGGVNPFAPSAPSTAAVTAPLIAPSVMQGSLPALPTVSTVPVPPPASTVPVPLAPVIPTSPAAGAVLDSKGLPWDFRIHASTKSLKADGTWTQKRNTPAETIVAVEAELKAGQAARVPPVLAVVPLSSAAPAVPAPPIVTETFGTLMAYIAPLLQDPAKAPHVTTALAAFSEPGKAPVSLAGLASRGDLWVPVKQYVAALIGAA